MSVEDLLRLRIRLLEVPWDPDGREIVEAEMDRLLISRDDLFVGLRNAGWTQSSSTVGRWLRGQGVPDVDELRLLTKVLAEADIS